MTDQTPAPDAADQATGPAAVRDRLAQALLEHAHCTNRTDPDADPDPEIVVVVWSCGAVTSAADFPSLAAMDRAHLAAALAPLVDQQVAAATAAVAALVAPQWRTIPHDLPDFPIEAFSAGRNWMIDQIRAVLPTTQPAGPPAP